MLRTRGRGRMRRCAVTTRLSTIRTITFAIYGEGKERVGLARPRLSGGGGGRECATQRRHFNILSAFSIDRWSIYIYI